MDHPRSRGVYASFSDPLCFSMGSSPLARGLLLPVERPDRDHGIIPARAGFTTQIQVDYSAGRDHPRSRGVYVVIGIPQIAWTGSSPLARGLLFAGDGPSDGARIIPARAGFTDTPRTVRFQG